MKKIIITDAQIVEQRQNLDKDTVNFTVKGGDGMEASDGYHTFSELYDHRVTLFIALCKMFDSRMFTTYDGFNNVWRSKLHSDGTSYDGWFVLGIHKVKGSQITYHIPMERWDETSFPGIETLDKAPEFDGHTSGDVLNRIKKL